VAHPHGASTKAIEGLEWGEAVSAGHQMNTRGWRVVPSLPVCSQYVTEREDWMGRRARDWIGRAAKGSAGGCGSRRARSVDCAGLAAVAFWHPAS
jgi:hypothetical protein